MHTPQILLEHIQGFKLITGYVSPAGDQNDAISQWNLFEKYYIVIKLILFGEVLTSDSLTYLP
jgi:hypothetical protein